MLSRVNVSFIDPDLIIRPSSCPKITVEFTDWVNGKGFPTGGLTGQVLQKKTNADYDTEWGTIPTPTWGNITGSIEDQTDLIAKFNTKQDVIADLDTIRSGSAKGMTAYQKPGTGIPGSDLDTAVQSSLNKANTALQSGSNVSLLNNDAHYTVSGSNISQFSNDKQYVDINYHDNAKQDVISDLDTIRSGSAKGATAYQKPGSGIPKSDMTSAVQTSLDKADTALQSASLAPYATKIEVSSSINSATGSVKSWADGKFITEHQSLVEYRKAADQNVIDATKATWGTTLTHYGITDAVKSVNNNLPDSSGNVVVRTFSSLPSSMDPYMSGTTSEFCEKLSELVNPEGGSAYLTGASFTDAPLSMRGGNFELIIYVPVSGVYLLEISSTDSFEELAGGIAGKWMAMYYGGTPAMNWQGVMTCPEQSVSGSYKYVPVNDSDGVSKYWLDTQLATKQATIADLDTIRSGSVKGSTALQPAALNPYRTSASQDTIDDAIKGRVTTLEGKTDLSDFTDDLGSSPVHTHQTYQDQINALKSIGRFLAIWNCTTGLPLTQPTSLPYTYRTGDYFRVGTVASGSGTNYKPNGSQYTGVASTTVESEEVKVGWVYYYDGTSWLAQSGGGDGKVQDVLVEGSSVLDTSTGVANVTKTSLGLNNVDNTSDLNKPISTAASASLATKQNIISDLDTIRTGAASGSTAYQKPVTGIPKSDLNGTVTASLNKADSALQSGSNVSLLNNDAGYVTNAYHDSTKVNEPTSEGTGGQVLTTNGSGGRSWTTIQSEPTTYLKSASVLNEILTLVNKDNSTVNYSITEISANDVETLWNQKISGSL